MGRNGWRSLAFVSATCAVALTGCGATASTASHQPEHVASARTSRAAAGIDRSSANDPLRLIATVTRSAKGTVFTERISLGRLRYGREGSPPPEVLSACEEAGETTIATSAFVRGAITVSYTHGALPAAAYFTLGHDSKALENIVGSLEPGEHEPSESLLVLNHEGRWDCRGDAQGHANLTFQPGQSQSAEVWLLLIGARTNEHPTLPQSTLDVLALNVGIASDSLGATPTTVVRGPAAATCRGAEEPREATRSILPFARLPHTAHYATGGAVACTG